MSRDRRADYMSLMKSYLEGSLREAEFVAQFLKLCDDEYRRDVRFGLGPVNAWRKRRTPAGARLDRALGELHTACSLFEHPDREASVSKPGLRAKVAYWYEELDGAAV